MVLAYRPSALAAIAFAAAALSAFPARGAIDQWSQIGPFGGPVTALAFDPTDPDAVYASTYTNGVFRSTDGGQGWAPSNVGLASRGVLSLAHDPFAPGTLYAGSYAGLSKSTDGGASWGATGFTGAVNQVVAPAAPVGGLYVLTSAYQIERSTDGGASWREVPTPLPSTIFESLAVDPRSADTLYLANPGYSPSTPYLGVAKTTDGGATWRQLATGLPVFDPYTYLRYSLAIAPDRPDTLFVASEADFPRRTAVARSTDGGESWTLLDGPGGFPILALPGGRVVTDRGVSTDSGTTWTSFPPPAVHVGALAVHPARPRQLLIGGWGLFRSVDDGASWNRSSQGMTATRMTTLAVGSDSTLYAGATGDGLFASRDGGGSWEHLLPPGGVPGDDYSVIRLLAVHPRRPRLLYAAVDGGSRQSLVRTDNGGASWTNLGPLPALQSLADLAFSPAVPDTVYAARQGDFSSGSCKVSRSTDRGATWKCLPLGQTTAIEVDPVDPRNLYALYIRVSKSTDGGASWSSQSYNRGLPQNFNRTFLVHAPGASGHLYLGGWEKLFRTTNGGRNWAPANGNLPSASLQGFAVDPRNPARIYAAIGGQGVYRSKDGGKRWTQLNRGMSGDLLGFETIPLAVDPRDPATIYVGTQNRGVFALTQTD
jgi:photosystem II stability/assembly factor-like uncharacterized protein